MHLSIDFWRTVAFSNPVYSQRRLDFLEMELKVSREIISTSLKEVGKFADNYNVAGHLHISEMYVMLLVLISKKVNDETLISRHDPTFLRKTVDRLFLEYPPILNFRLFAMIDWSSYDSINLSSNTGYISGDLIKSFLENTLSEFQINFYAFSDELECSKPQAKFFNHIRSQSKNVKLTHLGDDLFADIYGANSCGIDAIYYNNNCLKEYTLNGEHSNFYRLHDNGKQ
jgi:putative hydrolase of the HAD superfamily